MRGCGVLKSDSIVRVLTHLLYGIPPRWIVTRWSRHPRWHLSGVSIILATIQWLAYSDEMYTAATYWSSTKYGPEIKSESMMVIAILFLSTTVSYTVFMVYLYHPRHKFLYEGKTNLIPQFRFSPRGRKETFEASPMHWRIVNTFLMLGFLGVSLLVFSDFKFNILFDFNGIHTFINPTNIKHVSRRKEVIYKLGISSLYLGMYCVVVGCCVFYHICQDMVQHIDFTKRLIIEEARDFHTAKRYHECLLNYTEDMMDSIKWWFAIHNLFFVLLTLSIIVEWIVAFSKSQYQDKDIVYLVVAQVIGTSVIVFKYAFPFLAASRVTSRFDNMYKQINRKCNPRDFPDIDVFMSYCTRCKAGFTVFGVKVTAQLALFSLISCIVGFFKLYESFVASKK